MQSQDRIEKLEQIKNHRLITFRFLWVRVIARMARYEIKAIFSSKPLPQNMTRVPRDDTGTTQPFTIEPYNH